MAMVTTAQTTLATTTRRKRGRTRHVTTRRTDNDLQAEWRTSIQNAIDQVNTRIDQVNTRMEVVANQVSSIKAILDTYSAMAQSLSADRMSRATFEVSHKALEARVSMLENQPVLADRVIALERSPSIQRAWIAIGVSVLGVLGSIGCGGISVAVSILIAIVLHH